MERKATRPPGAFATPACPATVQVPASPQELSGSRAGAA